MPELQSALTEIDITSSAKSNRKRQQRDTCDDADEERFNLICTRCIVETAIINRRFCIPRYESRASRHRNFASRVARDVRQGQRIRFVRQSRFGR
ncbi:hypothetical protein PUN28_003520 [Cardiocondyla obscurior]|uniref:Uncharacterized protein n=1 Tax=Cardiocondyla obscurior TaxID=286306 RepID=A0AAW2GJB9_9HYME